MQTCLCSAINQQAQSSTPQSGRARRASALQGAARKRRPSTNHQVHQVLYLRHPLLLHPRQRRIKLSRLRNLSQPQPFVRSRRYVSNQLRPSRLPRTYLRPIRSPISSMGTRPIEILLHRLNRLPLPRRGLLLRNDGLYYT